VTKVPLEDDEHYVSFDINCAEDSARTALDASTQAACYTMRQKTKCNILLVYCLRASTVNKYQNSIIQTRRTAYERAKLQTMPIIFPFQSRLHMVERTNHCFVKVRIDEPTVRVPLPKLIYWLVWGERLLGHASSAGTVTSRRA
jgi:hypothetical protein